MRAALVCVLLGMLLTTAHADPFDVRNPVPDAPPSASSTVDTKPTVEILDPGYAQRRNAAVLAVGGGVLWGAALVVSRTMRSRFDEALARYEDGDYSARDEANHAQYLARVWGTSLFAAGAVAIGVSIGLYVAAPMKIRRERVMVAPALDHDSAGVAISGGF